MKEINFTFDQIELPAFEMLNGDWVFLASTVVINSELVENPNHAARWIANNVPKKWYTEIKLPGKAGRPGIYLLEPGLYFVTSQAKTDLGFWFRDKIFEEVLPTIRKQGGYISPTATNEQLEALQSQIDDLKQTSSRLRSTIFNEVIFSILKCLNAQGYLLPEKLRKEICRTITKRYGIVPSELKDDYVRNPVQDAIMGSTFYHRKREWLPKIILECYVNNGLENEPYAQRFKKDFNLI